MCVCVSVEYNHFLMNPKQKVFWAKIKSKSQNNEALLMAVSRQAPQQTAASCKILIYCKNCGCQWKSPLSACRAVYNGTMETENPVYCSPVKCASIVSC